MPRVPVSGLLLWDRGLTSGQKEKRGDMRMRFTIAVEEAQSLLWEAVEAVGTQDIELTAALGRILGQDLVAAENIPPFKRSPWDGYAFRAADTAEASPNCPIVLTVLEEVAAGSVPQCAVRTGTAVKVMTGAPIPEGADAVTKYEDITRTGASICIPRSFRSGENIVPAGEDVREGELIVKQGTLITPPIIGLMASLGITRVSVYKRPRVAILNTGDELIDIDEPLRPGKIRNSNRYALEAYCRDLGFEPVVLDPVADNRELIQEKIAEALGQADVVLTTGGVAVGDHDVVQDALRAMGAEILFWKVAMKPGSYVLAARFTEFSQSTEQPETSKAAEPAKLIVGLSGNPASSLVTFDLLVVPFLKKMAGFTACFPLKIDGVLLDAFPKKSPQRRFLRVNAEISSGRNQFRLTGVQSNGALTSMIGCNALVEVPEGSPPLPAGSCVKAYLVGKI